MSWRIVEEETSNVVASASHDLSTNRVLCLPRRCYVFRSDNLGESDDTFGLSNFEHWLTVDGESVGDYCDVTFTLMITEAYFY
eukprot:scaffold1411_cov141-Chaetoceros_neogracile.AAC.2